MTEREDFESIEDLSFTCTMTLEEARRRQEVANKTKGVTFQVSLDSRFPDRLVGKTTAVNLEALNTLNEALKSPLVTDQIESDS
jgi:hypothetical protein